MNNLVIFIGIMLLLLFTNLLNNNKFRDSILLITCIIITVILFYAGKSSPDYNQYINYYNDTILGYGKFKYEIGFQLLNKFLYIYFKFNYDYIFFSYYLIIMFFIYKGIKYFCNENISRLIFILLVVVNMITPASIIIRQYIAVAIMFYATRYIIDNNRIKFLLYLLLSASFHISSIIFLGLYFIFNINSMKGKYIKILVLISICILLINIPYISNKINGYIYGRERFIANDFGLVMLMFLILYLVNIILTFIKYKKIAVNDKQYITLLGTALYFTFYLVFIDFGFVNRLAFYFQPFMYLSICEIPYFYTRKYNKELITVCTIILLFIIYIR